jgi:glycosyltransferase involved in cell wall biosynthesis
MTRCLHVLPSLGGGGSERSLVELLPGLRASGIDPTVLCFGEGTNGYAQEVRALGVPVLVRPGHLIGRARSVRRVIGELEPDVVHTSVFDADLCGRLGAAGTGVPVVSSLVNTAYDPARRADPSITPWKLGAVRRADAVTARRLTDQFHAVTAAVADSAVDQLGIDRSRITVIERGRDLSRMGVADPARRAAVRASLGLAEDDEVVLAVGRLAHQKGHDVLIRAGARLRATRPRLRILIAGGPGAAGPLVHALLAAPEMAGVPVQLLGYRTDVADLLSAADLLALPSRYEGAAGAAIEAMAMGLPVVASDLPSLREVLDDGQAGAMFPAEDDAAMADAIGGLLDDDRRRTDAGAHGRNRFTSHHSLAVSAERFASWLHQCAGTPIRRPELAVR